MLWSGALCGRRRGTASAGLWGKTSDSQFPIMPLKADMQMLYCPSCLRVKCGTFTWHEWEQLPVVDWCSVCCFLVSYLIVAPVRPSSPGASSVRQSMWPVCFKKSQRDDESWGQQKHAESQASPLHNGFILTEALVSEDDEQTGNKHYASIPD